MLLLRVVMAPLPLGRFLRAEKKILLPVSRPSHIYVKRCNVHALREMLSCHSRAGHSSISSMDSRAAGGHHVLHGQLVPLVCTQQIISFGAITILKGLCAFKQTIETVVQCPASPGATTN